MKPNNQANSGTRSYKRWIRRVSVSLPIIGVVCMALLAATGYTNAEGSWKYVLGGFSMLFLISAAAFMMGGCVGFIFGLPKTRDFQPGPTSRYTDNKSMDQVADWLTKLIVGAGLVELHRMHTLVWALAGKLAEAFAKATFTFDFQSVIASALVFYLVSGFLNFYLATRLVLPSELERAMESGDGTCGGSAPSERVTATEMEPVG